MQLFRIPSILKLVYGVGARYNICWFPRELDNIFHAIGIFSYRGSNVMKPRLPTFRETFACSLYWIQNVRNMDFIYLMKTHKVQLRICETFNQIVQTLGNFPVLLDVVKLQNLMIWSTMSHPQRASQIEYAWSLPSELLIFKMPNRASSYS